MNYGWIFPYMTQSHEDSQQPVKTWEVFKDHENFTEYLLCASCGVAFHIDWDASSPQLPLTNRHSYGHFIDEKTKGKNNPTSTGQPSNVNLGPSNFSMHTSHHCLRPPPPVQSPAKHGPPPTCFHLIWYHCSNSAFSMFIFKKRGHHFSS
jgi:hypothetical protein